jgi:hypothetical protein
LKFFKTLTVFLLVILLGSCANQGSETKSDNSGERMLLENNWTPLDEIVERWINKTVEGFYGKQRFIDYCSQTGKDGDRIGKFRDSMSYLLKDRYKVYIKGTNPNYWLESYKSVNPSGFNYNLEIDKKIDNKLAEICKEKITQIPELEAILKKVNEVNTQEQTKIRRDLVKESELRIKWRLSLEKLNSKAQKIGYGNYGDYRRAQVKAAELIKAGAAYSLTGISREVQYVGCDGTSNSIWTFGDPKGYWSCFIRFLGEADTYSIEFSGNSWAGKPDGGDSAGKVINWGISKEFENWLNTQF